MYENMVAHYLNCSCIIAIDIIGASRLINIIAILGLAINWFLLEILVSVAVPLAIAGAPD